MSDSLFQHGRLQQPLHQKAWKIFYKPLSNARVLQHYEWLSILNEVHLLGLHKQQLLPGPTIKALLACINDLRQNAYQPLLADSAQRGFYLHYENYLIQQLGAELAGSLHIGRSRNDINATVFKLQLRDHYQEILQALLQLRQRLLKQATQYSSTAMPIYSQYQVAQIANYGYYLLAIENALARHYLSFKDLLVNLDESPLGAAAGCGTSFAIDSNYLAQLLGFSSVTCNALDAVANRDSGLLFLSNASLLATTLNRVAHDFQLWTTQEFALLNLPDELCGGSSMMPQKRNPYLLEVIKGRAARVNGALMQALTALHNVPFSNSLEVSTEAFHNVDEALIAVHEVLVLAELIIEHAQPNIKKMHQAIQQGLAMTTHIAEHRAQSTQTPFRTIHQDIGKEISLALSENRDPLVAALAFTPELEHADACVFAELNEFGSGPGKSSQQKALLNAQQRLQKDMAWHNAVIEQWQHADQHRQSLITQLI